MNLDVVVVGSANVDLSCSVDSLPKPGETVAALDSIRGAGGKGVNQAIAAARLGASVGFIGCVGDDEDGRFLTQTLVSEGVDIQHLTVVAADTSKAIINVDARGENSIVVLPGANANTSAEMVLEASSYIRSAKVVLTQFETPLETLVALRQLECERLIVNPAPAQQTALDPTELSGIAVLVPNALELEALAGDLALAESGTILEATKRLDVGAMVVTLGTNGVVVAESGEAAKVEAHVVDVVDTTGAGDAFCGALAIQLAGKADLFEAARFANAAAALAVTTRGAQAGLPTPASVQKLLASSS